MAERLSTGLANAINTVGSLKSIMDGGTLHLYSGTQPTSADDAETGDLLMKYTVDSLTHTPGSTTNGLTMGISTDGVLEKDLTETWSGVGEAAASTGTTCGYFRWYDKDVTTGDSTTAIRIDGAVSTASTAELQMTNPVISSGGSSEITSFPVTIVRS